MFEQYVCMFMIIRVQQATCSQKQLFPGRVYLSIDRGCF